MACNHTTFIPLETKPILGSQEKRYLTTMFFEGQPFMVFDALVHGHLVFQLLIYDEASDGWRRGPVRFMLSKEKMADDFLALIPSLD